jgi:hypothetical protein
MFKRRRFRQKATLRERLVAWAKQLRADAASLPAGPQKGQLLDKARHADTASHLDKWVNSRGLAASDVNRVSAVPQQLTLPPMVLLPIRIEHALDVTVQGLQIQRSSSRRRQTRPQTSPPMDQKQRPCSACGGELMRVR